MAKRLLLDGRRHWPAACCFLQLLLFLLDALQCVELVGCLGHKLLHLGLEEQCSALACSRSWVKEEHCLGLLCLLHCLLLLLEKHPQVLHLPVCV